MAQTTKLMVSQGFISDYVLLMDSVEFAAFVVGLAFDVIHLCETIPTDTDISLTVSSSPVVKIGMDKVSMARHGFLNSMLVPKVSIIQEFAKVISKRSTQVCLPVHKSIFLKALTTFKEWKQKSIEIDKQKHGANWGDSTGWNKWDPLEGVDVSQF